MGLEPGASARVRRSGSSPKWRSAVSRDGKATREAFQQRMSVEGDRHARALVEGDLEGERHDHLADPAGDLVDAPGPPGPELRADVEEHGDPPRARLGSEHQVEIGQVDAHEHVGRLVAQQPQESAVEADHGEQPPEHRGEADDRELVRLAVEAQAGPTQLLAADAEGLRAGIERPELLEDARAIDVRARLADDHHHPRAAAGRQPRAGPRVGFARESVKRLEGPEQREADARAQDRAARDVEGIVLPAGDAREADESSRQEEQVASARAKAVDQRGGGRERDRGVSRRKRFVRQAGPDPLDGGRERAPVRIADLVLRYRQPARQQVRAGGPKRGGELGIGQRPGALDPILQAGVRAGRDPDRGRHDQQVLGKAAAVEREQAEPEQQQHAGAATEPGAVTGAGVPEGALHAIDEQEQLAVEIEQGVDHGSGPEHIPALARARRGANLAGGASLA